MKTIGLISLVFLINIALSQAQEPQWDWVEGLYTPDEERATAVASDPNTAEVYLAGEWRGTLAGFFPAGPTESTDFAATYGGVDGIVVKLDPAGNVMWAFKVGGEGDDRINDIHVDHQNNFYITGSMGAGTAVFSGTSSVTADSLFFNPSPAMCYLAKYDPLGRLLWFRWAANDNLAHGKAITSNSSAVFLTGHHQGTIQFGPHPPYASVGGDDIFIVKYTMDGAEEWHVAAGSDKDDFGEGIACDETHLYVAGSFNGAVLDYKDMSGGMITATINTADGQADVFVASSTTDGFHEWTRIIASALDDDCRGVALDSDHIYLAGTIGQEAIFPLYAANPVPYKGGEDAYVCAISRADGATRWVSTLTGDADGDQVVRDLSMDMSGGLYVTGFFTTNVTTTDVINDSKGVEDVFLAAYNRSGDEKWIKTAGSEGIDMGNGVCASTPGTVYLAGEYDDFTAFDSDLLPADGNQNMFVASLNLDCVDAIGGILSAPETVIPEGEAITLVLKNYLGDILWEFSLPGMNNWALLTADLSDSIQVFPSGTGDYRAFVTSGDCAPDSSNVIRIEVVNANIRFADAGEDVKICPGDSIQLKASGGDFYKWDPVDGLEPPDVPDPWAKPLITTSYVVHVTNADGLTDTDTVTVIVLPRPKVNAGADIEACQGEQVELSAQGD
ncbi:MAG: hypothetical protein KAT15_03900, partial [Bacteroidales bacterium]|nr:hypothetical protein [Bacteroidales bacterium]